MTDVFVVLYPPKNAMETAACRGKWRLRLPKRPRAPSERPRATRQSVAFAWRVTCPGEADCDGAVLVQRGRSEKSGASTERKSGEEGLDTWTLVFLLKDKYVISISRNMIFALEKYYVMF